MNVKGAIIDFALIGNCRIAALVDSQSAHRLVVYTTLRLRPRVLAIARRR